MSSVIRKQQVDINMNEFLCMQVSFCDEVGSEVKFIIKCSGNTKPVRKSGSANSEEALFSYGNETSNYGSNNGYGYSEKK